MKEPIRKKFLEKRGKINKEENKEKAEIIKEKLFSLEEYKKAKTVMFYVSFGSEVFTHDMVEEALKDKTVIVPKIVEFEIVPCRIDNFTELEPGKYRILEPVDCSKEQKNNIDIILVPGIAFDKRGYRIGYGKGYYDRLLKRLNAKRIALCFDTQIIDKVPDEDHDEKMDIIVSEKKIIKAK